VTQAKSKLAATIALQYAGYRALGREAEAGCFFSCKRVAASACYSGVDSAPSRFDGSSEVTAAWCSRASQLRLALATAEATTMVAHSFQAGRSEACRGVACVRFAK
jgi:hypothetical protein